MDATTTLSPIADTVVDDGPVVVNGPEDEPVEWDAVDWRAAEEDVRRLRQRIFAATRAEDWKTVRNLQKLMVRHEARVSRMGVKDRHRPIVVAVG